jgi:hypothetical protein
VIALASLVLWWSACSSVEPLPPGDPARPDVVVVSIDTLRADHIGAYGYHRNTTPFLDAQAALGIRYASAWSPSPWTLPSHATLLTGRLPPEHGAVEGDRAIREGGSWLPEAFRSAGYSTLGVVSSWFVSRRYGFDRGFDSFFDFDFASERENLTQSPKAEQVFGKLLALGRTLPAGRPAFVFVHVYDVHYPYAPPGDWDQKFDRPSHEGESKYRNYEWYLKHPLDPASLEHQRSQYDEELAYVDDQLRQFHERWTARRPAVFVVVSDHGEEFGERGSWGHGHTLWPEQLHVPWIVFGPGVSAEVVEGRVGLEDVAPTLAGLTQIGLEGVSGVDRSAAAADRLPGGRYAETSRFRSAALRWHARGMDAIWDLKGKTSYLCDLTANPTCAGVASNSNSADLTAWESELAAAMSAFAPSTLRPLTVEPGGWTFLNRRLVASVEHRSLATGEPLVVFPWDQRFQLREGQTSRETSALDVGNDFPGAVTGGHAGGGVVPLSESEKNALEALGYVQ